MRSVSESVSLSESVVCLLVCGASHLVRVCWLVDQPVVSLVVFICWVYQFVGNGPWLVGWLVSWLVGQSVSRLVVCWLVSWLVGQSVSKLVVGWLVSLSVGWWLVGWSVCRLVGWSVCQLVGWSAGWLVSLSAGWLVSCLVGFVSRISTIS